MEPEGFEQSVLFRIKRILQLCVIFFHVIIIVIIRMARHSNCWIESETSKRGLNRWWPLPDGPPKPAVKLFPVVIIPDIYNYSPPQMLLLTGCVGYVYIRCSVGRNERINKPFTVTEHRIRRIYRTMMLSVTYCDTFLKRIYWTQGRPRSLL